MFNSASLRILPSPRATVLWAITLSSLAVVAQEAAPESPKPQVKVNYLNVCMPPENEKQELAAALSHIPSKPRFIPDFEVSRGLSTASEPPVEIAGSAGALANSKDVSRWVRVRREFPSDSPFISVQYTISTAGRGAVESLVFRARDPKDVLQILLEARASAADPTTLIKADTPADRIRLERFGKSSIALAHCPGTDQSGFDPLFRQGSMVLAAYRQALEVRQTVPGDLRRLGVTKPQSQAQSSPRPQKSPSRPDNK